MLRPMIIPVGGFLGAGKTSLILAAARLLTSRSIKSAAILNALSAGQLEIDNLKLADDTASGFLKAAITRNGQSPTVEGNLAASPSDVHELLLNIRASGNPSS